MKPLKLDFFTLYGRTNEAGYFDYSNFLNQFRYIVVSYEFESFNLVMHFIL